MDPPVTDEAESAIRVLDGTSEPMAIIPAYPAVGDEEILSRHIRPTSLFTAQALTDLSGSDVSLG
jgi:hypothetical protein